MQALGYNYRFTDFQCALGLSQLKARGVGGGAERHRRAVPGAPRERGAGGAAARRAPGWLHGYHLFPVQILAGAEARLAVFDAMRAAGIGVQVHYIPIYRLPYYRDVLGHPQDECPAARPITSAPSRIPVFPAMNVADVERVVRRSARLSMPRTR